MLRGDPPFTSFFESALIEPDTASLLAASKSPHSYLSRLYSTADAPTSLQLAQVDLILKEPFPRIWSLDLGHWNKDDVLVRLATTLIPQNSSQFSVISLPGFPHELFFEANSIDVIESEIIKVSELSSRLSHLVELTSHDIVRKFCNYTRLCRIHTGSFAQVQIGVFHNDFGQIVHVAPNEGEVILKLRPRIDYDGLRTNHYASQVRLTAEREPTYRPPPSFFKPNTLSELNAEIKESTLDIGQPDPIPVRVWDQKTFYGRFQYERFSCSMVKLRSFTIPFEVKAVFDDNVNGVERTIPGFTPNGKSPSKPRRFVPMLPSASDLTQLSTSVPAPPPVRPSPGSEVADRAPEPEPKPEPAPVLRPPPFAVGDTVVPVAGPYAGLPARVEFVGQFVVASLDTEARFTVPGGLAQWVASPPDEGDAPRRGDLVRLPGGAPAVVIGEGCCRDLANVDHAVTVAALSRETRDDPSITDSVGARVNIGDTVTAVHGGFTGSSGKVLWRVDEHLFVGRGVDITAVPARDAVVEGPDGFVGSQIVVINQGVSSSPYTVISLGTDGVIRARGHDVITLPLSEIGVRWRPAREVDRATAARGTLRRK
jgi:hypothetical protein